MAVVADIRSWIGKDVVDGAANKLGKFTDVYFDVESDQPVFLVVDPGRRTRNILVPAWNASVTPDLVQLPYSPEELADAPGLDVDGDLDTGTERELFAFYKVEYVPSNTGSGRRLMRH